VAQLSLIAARHVTLCKYNEYGVSFILRTVTMTYELRNMTHATLARWVGRISSPVLFFAVSGPKFTKLSIRAEERLQFATPFPFDDILFHFGDILD